MGLRRYTAMSPNYDASWEGEEDGWVSNGQCVEARTLEGVCAEIDTWLEENEPASVDERPEGRDGNRLGAKPASAVRGAQTPKDPLATPTPEITPEVGS